MAAYTSLVTESLVIKQNRIPKSLCDRLPTTALVPYHCSQQKQAYDKRQGHLALDLSDFSKKHTRHKYSSCYEEPYWKSTEKAKSYTKGIWRREKHLASLYLYMLKEKQPLKSSSLCSSVTLQNMAAGAKWLQQTSGNEQLCFNWSLQKISLRACS